MKNLKKGTKAYEDYMRRSKCYKGDDLSKVYTTCSSAKKAAECNIKEMMRKLDGYNYHICGKNCNTFSCSFETKTHIYFFTHCNTYVMEK